MFKQSLCTLLLSCLPLVALSEAQYGGGGGGDSATTTTSAEMATETASSSSGIHTVDVGEDGFVFTPDSLNVAPGGKVEFHFYPGNHSVAQASFDNPCHPMSNDAFFSGFVSPSNGESSTVFTLTVNDTTPLWFYCGQIGHCAAGMVGVINPSTSGPDTLAAFKKAAAMSTPATVPADVQGGILSTEKSSEPDTTGGGPTATGGGTTATGGSSSSTASPSPSSPNEGKRLQFSTDLGVMSFFTFIVAMFMV